MKKKVFIAAFVLAALPMAAQETYENAKIAAEDLNGTARFVGMGGAMDALGADISTIGTNPAGIGLFRSSTASVSFGMVSQQDANNFADGHATRASFDQLGFVVATHSGHSSFLNFGFNYHKSRNFNMLMSATDKLKNASQNKLTYAKAKNGLLFDVDPVTGVPDGRAPLIQCNQLDDIYARNLNYDEEENMWIYDPANSYTFDRSHKGYVGEYDFNISTNINDRVYLGLTMGIHDVNYSHYGEYTEQMDGFGMLVADERKIEGSGFDIKAGIIIRPIETSPFRMGLSVSTPTWYELTTSNFTTLSDGTLSVDNSESYDFALATPWKFGFSLGHTVGNYLALGAGIDYTDYGSMDTRIITGEHYDYWYDNYYSESESDTEMNRHTNQTLKGVTTLKLGLEYKPMPEMAVRFGYNYVSPMYNKDGFKDGTLPSPGSYYSSATDFTNWKATNRITCGLGYYVGKWNIDVAYQYNATKGDFRPFMNCEDFETVEDDNLCNPVEVKNNRHQLLFTLGYRF